MADQANLPDAPPSAPGFLGLYFKLKGVSRAADAAATSLTTAAAAAVAAKAAGATTAPQTPDDIAASAVAGSDHLQKLFDSTVGGYLTQIVQTLDALKDDSKLGPNDRVHILEGLQRQEALLRKFDSNFSLDEFERRVKKATTQTLVDIAAGRVAMPSLGASGGGTGGFRLFGTQAPAPAPQSLASQISTGQVKG